MADAANPEAAPELSAVITCYFEEKTIEEFHARLSEALEKSGRSYEIIFVNDGSTDSTFEKLKAIFAADRHVRAVLDLFRNAGQPAAVTAGLAETRGRVILSMDSDLQLAPEDLPRLLEQYDNGYDVVSGYRQHRKDSVFRTLPSLIANVIMRKTSGAPFRDFGCTFKLYNANLIRAFDYGPLKIFNPATVIAKTQRCVEVPVSHTPRKHGQSGWTFRKLWNYQMDQIVELTDKPFQYLALAALFLAVLFLARVLISYLVPFRILSKVSNGLLLNVIVIVFLVLLGGISLVGEFSIRSFTLSRQAPRYIVREMLKR